MKPNLHSLTSALLATLIASLAAAQTDSVTFDTEIRGRGQPIIFIPGLACHGEVWEKTVSRYETELECHILTLSGFAGAPSAITKLPPDSFLATVKEELDAYIRERDLEKPIVVGHSLGGFVGLWLAADSPDLLGGVVAVDSLPFFPAAMDPNATPESARDHAAATRGGMIHASTEQIRAQQEMILPSMISDPDRVATALEWSLQSDMITVAQAMYELNTTDLRPSLSNITAPTLVLGAWIGYQAYGATRESTEAIFREQYRNLPNYRLEMTDEGKHFIMWDDPDFLFQHLDAFLADSVPAS